MTSWFQIPQMCWVSPSVQVLPVVRHPKHRASKRLSIAPGSDPRATESQESWGDGGQRNSSFKSPHSSHMAVDLT